MNHQTIEFFLHPKIKDSLNRYKWGVGRCGPSKAADITQLVGGVEPPRMEIQGVQSVSFVVSRFGQTFGSKKGHQQNRVEQVEQWGLTFLPTPYKSELSHFGHFPLHQNFYVRIFPAKILKCWWLKAYGTSFGGTDHQQISAIFLVQKVQGYSHVSTRCSAAWLVRGPFSRSWGFPEMGGT